MQNRTELEADLHLHILLVFPLVGGELDHGAVAVRPEVMKGDYNTRHATNLWQESRLVRTQPCMMCHSGMPVPLTTGTHQERATSNTWLSRAQLRPVSSGLTDGSGKPVQHSSHRGASVVATTPLWQRLHLIVLEALPFYILRLPAPFLSHTVHSGPETLLCAPGRQRHCCFSSQNFAGHPLYRSDFPLCLSLVLLLFCGNVGVFPFTYVDHGLVNGALRCGGIHSSHDKTASITRRGCAQEILQQLTLAQQNLHKFLQKDEQTVDGRQHQQI